jgi:hypothetical protein
MGFRPWPSYFFKTEVSKRAGQGFVLEGSLLRLTIGEHLAGDPRRVGAIFAESFLFGYSKLRTEAAYRPFP